MVTAIKASVPQVRDAEGTLSGEGEAVARDDFARRLRLTRRAVARDVGHPSAHSPTRDGRLEALRQRLRMMAQPHECSDVQGAWVRAALRRATAADAES